MRNWTLLGAVMGLALAVGCAGTRYRSGHPHHPTNCDHQAHDNTVEVTTAGVSCKDIYIKKNVDSIVWYSADGTKLKVKFDDDPFDDLSCIDNECTAYWVKGEITRDTTFKYYTFLNGKLNSDPNVIIKPSS